MPSISTRPAARQALALRVLIIVAAVFLAAGAGTAAPPKPKVDRFDEKQAWSWLVRQVELGPRPAGWKASRRLGDLLEAALPGSFVQGLPGGLRNVFGVVRGKDAGRVVVVGAHYDTKDLPGFVGANDGAGGTAVVVQLARTLRPRTIRPTVVFALFDGEEAPAGVPDTRFLEAGLRGSKAAVRLFPRAEAMILLDFVADRDLSIPREALSDKRLWVRLRAAAARVGVGSVFPDRETGPVLDDHYPFLQAGIPSIDLIDFDFPCWHRACDDLSAVSMRSLDATGETVLELLRGL